jgi:hypothetical protein
MRIIFAEYNMYHNSIDIATYRTCHWQLLTDARATYAGYVLRIDCNKAEDGLRTTPGSQCALNALAIDNPLEYACLYLDGTMQMWVDAEDSLELW